MNGYCLHCDEPATGTGYFCEACSRTHDEPCATCDCILVAERICITHALH